MTPINTHRSPQSPRPAGGLLRPDRANILWLIIISFIHSHDPVRVWAGEPRSVGGPEIPISVLKGAEEEDPVVASDGKNYMVVWQTNRKGADNYDVYAARVGPDGKGLDPQGIPISTAPSNQIFTDIARGDGQYLIVWQDLRSRQSWEIYGARLRFDGKVLDPDGIPIAIGRQNAEHPQVAWDGKNFLVVWMEENKGSGSDIAAARINPEGKVLDPDRVLIPRTPGVQTHPALAWGMDHYLIVWMEQGGISCLRLDPSGKVLDPNGIVLARPSRGGGYPSVAWGKDRFVVIWGDQPSSPAHAISGVRVRPSGEGVDVKEFRVAISSRLQVLPSVSCSGEACLTVWEEDQSTGRPRRSLMEIIRDVRGAFIDLEKENVTSNEVMIAPKAVGNHFAKVASNGQGFLVVWKDYRTGTAASLGRFVTSPH